jgi:type I restriction enzyme S subunit
MSFPQYERYKHSGVEWLGKVPEHWLLKKLGSIATFRGGGTPAKDKADFWNGDIPWVSPKDMKSESIEKTEDAITEAGLASSSTSLIPPGAVLMVVRSGILKHTIPVAINRIAVTLNQDMKAIVLDPVEGLSEFFLRWVQGLNELLLHVWLKQGATVESVEQSYVSSTDFPLPPISEQQDICSFLQVETAKIDQLVKEHHRLIGLLQERRSALISAAVTGKIDVRNYTRKETA